MCRRRNAESTDMNAENLTIKGDYHSIVERAVQEDVGPGDATSEALVDPQAYTTAHILAKGHYIVSGCLVAKAVFEEVDPAIQVTVITQDSFKICEGGIIMEVYGPALGILKAERTALNFLQRMSGIATLTRRYVDVVAPYGVQILDTRKTTPTLRILEKYAVRCGGGRNHRMALYDRVMIKDNHRRFWSQKGEGSLAECVQQARTCNQDLDIEVEVDTVQEFMEVLPAHPDWILLDNMTTDELSICVSERGDEVVQLEASGGITLLNLEEVARTGVDAVSVGMLTHSFHSADLSLEFVE